MKTHIFPISILLSLLSPPALWAQQNRAPESDHLQLRSTPANVVRGQIAADLPPVLTMKSGQAVDIQTVSHQGLNTAEGPVAFFGKAGIKSGDVLQDAVEIYAQTKPPAGGHVLTGPIQIENAEAGDMLEVRILDFGYRVPYGVNASNKGSGVLPDALQGPDFRVIRLDPTRRVAMFSPSIEIPLAPFMGIMAVAPPDVERVSSRPPGPFGGNLDLKQLTRGATLYLPVFRRGALFFTGDPHAAQGDGEVDGTAIEASLTVKLQFFVHKAEGRSLIWPRAETPTHYIVMGIGQDLNAALQAATQDAVNFLKEQKGLSAKDAYELTSIAVDFRVAEAVNVRQVVYGMIPKSVFAKQTAYWYNPQHQQ